MHRPSFNQPRHLWHVDGSLRDAYIQGAALQDWASLLEVARSYTHHYFRDGVAMALPDAETIFSDREHSHLLRIESGAVRVHCHFFISEEVELDIDPREVLTSAEHLAVLEFLERLGNATGKDVMLTEESSPEIVLLRFEPNTQLWHAHELPAACEA